MGSRLETNSNNVRKRIEQHAFGDEGGEEYEASTFGGFGDYMRRKKLKLQNLDVELRSQDPDKPKIFKGLVAHVNGYTQPSLNDLHKLIVTHGGGFLQYLDGKTVATHVIASNLTPKKKVEFAKYRIAKPAWIVDSVRAGKVLPWDDYRLVDEGITQKVLGFDDGRMMSQANRPPRGYRDQTESSWYTSQIKTGVSDPESRVIRNQTGQKNPESSAPPEKPDDASRTSTQRDLSFLVDQIAAEDEADIEEPTENDSNSDHGKPSTDSPVKTTLASTSSASLEMQKSVTPENPLSAEEHNARLLSDPHLAKSSTANPDFLQQYYRESRLHHLSAWKADLKARLQSLASKRTSSQESRLKRPPGARRYILHVDFDCFFASVSLRKHPELSEKPVVVAHGSGPGSEIASCNYPARKFGVKNGMWMQSALQLCPDLKVLPYDYKAYEEASKRFYEAIIATDGLVQSVSIDEALVDISSQCIINRGKDGKGGAGDLLLEQQKADRIATDLRSTIKEASGCDVSVGVGNNILLAKVALRKAKPAGQYQVKPEEVLDFIGDLKVQDLPGVAYSLGGKLQELGVKQVKDIRALSKERLVTSLGPKTGEKLWAYAQGIDKTEVGNETVRKSVSAEINWGIRFVTQQQADEFVQCMCDELSRRLLEQGMKGRQLTMKILKRAADAPVMPAKSLGHGKCDTFNKSVVLGVTTNDRAVIGKEAVSVLKSYNFSPGELRGIGVQMQKLEPIKPASRSAPSGLDSSQLRLRFMKPVTTSASKEPSSVSTPVKPSRIQDCDPIEQTPTPEKKDGSVIKGAVPLPPTRSESAYKPLNLTGTQFVMPFQTDSTVLAELQSDIRAKLQAQPKKKDEQLSHTRPTEEEPSCQVNQSSISALPNQSQLDPEILNSLPRDVRAEILAHYNSSTNFTHPQQQLLPQSPRKPQFTAISSSTTPTKPKSNPPPPKPRRGRPPKTASLQPRNPSHPTLTQANFISIPQPPIAGTSPPKAGLSEPSAISSSFLAALPPDLQAEILDDQRRQRLRAKGVEIPATHTHRPTSALPDAGAAAGSVHTVPRPARVEKPTFTSRKLSSLDELRPALEEWVRECSEASTSMPDRDEGEGEGDVGDVGDVGPHPEDVAALADYLGRVVREERDVDKAETLVRWVEWVVAEVCGAGSREQGLGEGGVKGAKLREIWARTIGELRERVESALRGRDRGEEGDG